MSTDSHDFATFIHSRKAISFAYVQGDCAPLQSILSERAPSTLFGVKGAVVASAAEVLSAHEKEADAFESGSVVEMEVLHMSSNDGLACWAGIVRVSGRMKGRSESLSLAHRVTEIFRLEASGWKMVHRHADPLVEPLDDLTACLLIKGVTRAAHR